MRRMRTRTNQRHTHAGEVGVHSPEGGRLHPSHARRRLLLSHGRRPASRLTRNSLRNATPSTTRWYSPNCNFSFGDKPAEATAQVMDSLKDQVAVVTGASSGIGKAIALSVARHGAEVCLVARRRELLEEVARQIHALGLRGHACPADLTKDDDIRGLGEQFQKNFCPVNILFLSAGPIFHGPLAKAC